MKRFFLVVFLMGLMFLMLWGMRILEIRYEHNLDFHESIKYYFKSDNKDELYLEEYNNLLACHPVYSIDKKELFSRAMQDYWIHEVKSMFDDFKKYSGDFKKRPCKPIYYKGGSPSYTACFPRVINKYNTLERMYQFVLQSDSLDQEEIRLFKILNEDVYLPEKDGYLYSPVKSISEINFSVYNFEKSLWYPKDCCKLIDYKKLLSVINKSKENNLQNHKMGWRSDIFPVEFLESQEFLVVKSLEIKLNKEMLSLFFDQSRSDDFKYEYTYFPVSPCGKILTSELIEK